MRAQHGGSERSGITAFAHRLRTGRRNSPMPISRSSSTRTIEVKGNLHFGDSIKRSKSSQREAGGADRRATDDGGHFIAARFDGPTEAFNYFAQDANFNRGSYRVIENRWAQDLRSGKHVSVDITAQYLGSSRRPHSLTVRWITNGLSSKKTFLNERQGG